MQELKPCPFCGSENTLSNDQDEVAFVVCLNCLADGPVKETERESIDAWNRRA